MKPEDVKVDPRISVKVVPDGEVHLVFQMSAFELEEFARGFIAYTEGRMKPEQASLAFRMKNVAALDHVINMLLDARRQAWPNIPPPKPKPPRHRGRSKP